MSDIFQKLNVLLRAGMRDLVGEDPLKLATIRDLLRSEQFGKDFEREVVALRQKINEAIDYEDMLTARVQEFQTEVERLDQQADRAVALGEEDRARTLLVQRERAVQRLTMAESDLREHRFVTQELIQRVNQLEAVVAEIPEAQPVSEQPVEAGGNNLAAILRQAREQLVRESPRNSGETPDKSGTEADLEQRRRRLSKPSP
ncbi:MAG: hypothetical protein KJ065_20065 [Anaerolineae bacterium]|nr:hypothetical protein [Anaerolineae bacterium]